MRTTRVWLAVGLLAIICAAWTGVERGESSSSSAPLSAVRDGSGPWRVSTVTELLEAIDEVPSTGGTILLDTGTYVIDRVIEIQSKSFVNLVGTGWDTKIVRRGNGDALRLTDSGFCTIRNLLLQGDETAVSGSAICYQGHCSSCSIDCCRIVNFAESGVCYVGDSKHPMSSNAVRNCHLIGNLGDQLRSVHNNDFHIVGNQFGTHRAFPRSGCLLDHSSAGTYSMNYHWGNQVALRMGPRACYNRMENNRFEESREAGLLIGTADGDDWNMFNIISGNTFHTNSQAQSGEFSAVVAYDAHDTTFCGNQVFSWDAERIRHKHSLLIGDRCDNWIVKDNIFRHNASPAIVYDPTKPMIVKDNLTD